MKNPDRHIDVRSVLLILISLLLTCSTGFAQSKKSAREAAWGMIERNNPDAYKFMNDWYALPTEIRVGNMQITVSKQTDFMEYIHSYDAEGILSDIGTAVHESCHGYESMKVFSYINSEDIAIGFDDNFSVYYLSANEEYLVKHTKTFPSLKFAGEIPDRYRTFRYDTYINSRTPNLGTQLKGIYGLMDEWTAYYNGFKTTVLNFPEYKNLANRNVSKYLKYIEHAASHKVAYYEFKYYLVHYLYYARANHPEIYNQIINNTAFLESIRAVDLYYSAIIREYEQNIGFIGEDVKLRGEFFQYEKGTVWIGNDGIGTFYEEEKLLKEAIHSIKYAKILELFD